AGTTLTIGTGLVAGMAGLVAVPAGALDVVEVRMTGTRLSDPRLVDSGLTGAVTAGGKPAVLVAAAARRCGPVLASDGRLLGRLLHGLPLRLSGQRRILDGTIRDLVGRRHRPRDLRVGGHIEPVLVLVAVRLLAGLGRHGRRLVAEHAVLFGLAECAGEALQ